MLAVNKPDELGAYFSWEHAYQPDDAVIEAAQQFLDREYANIPWPVEFVEYQPYESSKAMRAAVLSENVLRISTEGNGGPLGLHYNLLFRAVHDQHHVLIEAPFNFSGEARASAYMLHLIDADESIPADLKQDVKAFHFSEMMGQVAYYYTHGRTYLDEQYAVRYPNEVIAAFQARYGDGHKA